MRWGLGRQTRLWFGGSRSEMQIVGLEHCVDDEDRRYLPVV
jgi:hypothetical protein